MPKSDITVLGHYMHQNIVSRTFALDVANSLQTSKCVCVYIKRNFSRIGTTKADFSLPKRFSMTFYTVSGRKMAYFIVVLKVKKLAVEVAAFRSRKYDCK